MGRATFSACSGVLALCTALVAASPAHAFQQTMNSCRPRGSDTELSTRYVRVFTFRGVTYACLKSQHRAFWLGDVAESEASSGVTVGPLSSAGRYVAYGVAVEDRHDGSSSYDVRVRDVRSGRRVRVREPNHADDGLFDGGVADPGIRDIVVTARASVAWTVRDPWSDPVTVQVWSAARGKVPKLLADAPAGIDADSLGATRGRVHWVQDDARHEAALP